MIIEAIVKEWGLTEVRLQLEIPKQNRGDLACGHNFSLE